MWSYESKQMFSKDIFGGNTSNHLNSNDTKRSSVYCENGFLNLQSLWLVSLTSYWGQSISVSIQAALSTKSILGLRMPISRIQRGSLNPDITHPFGEASH